MTIIPKYSHTLKKKNSDDLCPVCDKDLFLTTTLSQRVGLLESDNTIAGWICPFCETEFGNNDEIVYIYGRDSIKGNT